MPTNDEVDEAMTDIAHLAARAGISTRPAAEPSPSRQETLLLRILATEPPRITQSPRRIGLRVLAATTAVAASLAFGLALVSQQGGSGPDRRASPVVATQKISSPPGVGSGSLQGTPLTVPKTPEQWLAAQAGRDVIIARRTSAFVYDAAQSEEWDQPMGTAQMIVTTSLNGKLRDGDTFTVESAVTRRGTFWDSAVLEQGLPYLLFPDSYGPATYIVNGDIYSFLDADHYELVESTGSNAAVQPPTISVSSFRSLLANRSSDPTE